MKRRSDLSDQIFKVLTLAFATVAVVLTAIYFTVVVTHSTDTLMQGLSFFFGTKWLPAGGVLEIFPMIYGSMVTSAIALAIGVPVSLGVAVFLSEFCPHRLRSSLSLFVEMLAAIPSVVYGIWGIFVLAPIMTTTVDPFLERYLGFLPIFSGTIFGFSIMTAGVILSIMIIPIVASISRDALQAVPDSQREAAYALGATHSEAIRTSVVTYARTGVIASIFLGFGRAFGETMAVIMIIGNSPVINPSLFHAGATLASVIATDFPEAPAVGPLYLSALFEAALALLIVSFLVNVVARLMIRRLIRSMGSASLL